MCGKFFHRLGEGEVLTSTRKVKMSPLRPDEKS